ncbi:TPA: RimK family alpha-L-glutamate ligase [Candidatus Poribacteria bacterium]|nr:RimK family alpha-L-glutamate ligase [Candidatus Poribacteria bacterium]
MRIGILSRGKENYSVKRLHKAANRMGHVVTLMDPFDCYLHIGCKGHAIYHRRRPVNNLDVVIPRLGAATARYGLAVIEHFEWVGVPLVNSARAIDDARNKFRSLRILASHDIPVPPTFTIGSTEFLEQSVRRTGNYPFIAKPFEGTQGKGIMLLDTPRSLSSTIGAMCDLYRDYIIQPFIEEAKGRDIRALVIGGELICAMQRIARGSEFRANIHRGAVGIMIELKTEYAEIALKAAAAMQLGISGVDILATQKGPVVIEVNPSPGFEGLEAATGMDIARKMIKYAVACARAEKSC